MKTRIALRYENAVVLPHNANQEQRRANRPLVASLINEMGQLGFTPTEQLTNAMLATSERELAQLHTILVDELKKKVGADVSYQPMYPNFPKQVMEANYAELVINAMLHYLTSGQWMPGYEKEERLVEWDAVNTKQIGVIDEDQFNQIFARLAGSNESLSEDDKQTIKWFLLSDQDYQLPDQIPFKENLCFIAGVCLENGQTITPFVSTATDVLRIATYLSDGDISLAEPVKFKSLSRSTRRELVNALEQVAREEDIARHRNRWIRLFHNLHVGDYSSKVYNLAKKVRNNEKIRTFNSDVEQAIDNLDVEQAANLLTNRPGEFARRLDQLIRLENNVHVNNGKRRTGTVAINRFADVADHVPTRTLLQLIGHFNTRTEQVDSRVVFPKGSTQKAVNVETPLEPLSPSHVDKIVSTCQQVLKERFAQLEPLGNVWIDPQLANCPIPTQMRSASSGLYQVARGTRLPFGDDDRNTLRFFIYWVGRDIDLSATMHNENFEMTDTVAYFNLRNEMAFHSGDIVNAPEGASEFIDIQLDRVPKGVRYVAMNVYVFGGPTFAEHEKVYAGWMTRSKPQSNEVYDPTTVEQKIDLTADTFNSVPVVFDVVERKAIWADLTTISKPRPHAIFGLGGNNTLNNRATVEQTVRAMLTLDNKVTLDRLFTMHTVARGQLVDNREEADIAFALDGDVTPYNIDVINSEYVV